MVSIDNRFFNQMEYIYDDLYGDQDYEYDQDYYDQHDEYQLDRVAVLDDRGHTVFAHQDFDVNSEPSYDEYETDEGRVYDSPINFNAPMYQKLVTPQYRPESILKLDADTGKPLVRSLKISPSWVTKNYPEEAKRFDGGKLIQSGPFPIDLTFFVNHLVRPIGIKTAILIDYYRQGKFQHVEYNSSEKFDDYILDLILANDLPQFNKPIGTLVHSESTFGLYYYQNTFIIVPTKIIKESKESKKTLDETTRLVVDELVKLLFKGLSQVQCETTDVLKNIANSNRILVENVLLNLNNFKVGKVPEPEILQAPLFESKEPKNEQVKAKAETYIPTEKYIRKIKTFRHFLKLEDIKILTVDEAKKKWADYCHDPKQFDIGFITKTESKFVSQPNKKNAKKGFQKPYSQYNKDISVDPYDPKKANFSCLKEFRSFHKLKNPDVTEVDWTRRFEDYKLHWIERDLLQNKKKQQQKEQEPEDKLVIVDLEKDKTISFVADKTLTVTSEIVNESKLENTLSLDLDIKYANSVVVYKGNCPDAKYKISDRSQYVGNASILTHKGIQYLAINKHYFHGFTANDKMTFVGKGNAPVVLSISEIGLKHTLVHAREDLVLTQNPKLISLSKSFTVDCVRGKKYPNQVSLTFVSDTAPSGVWYSVGHVTGLCTDLTPVTYNSEEGACGAPVIGQLNRIIGIHAATASIFNCFLSFAESHFVDLVNWDF